MEGQGDSKFWWWLISNRRGIFKFMDLQGDPPFPPSLHTHTQFPPLMGHPDLPIRKTLRRVLGLFTAMILKRVSESIYFQSNKFTTCKVKGEKEVTNSLMALNLLKIIHPFQGKKYLRT